MTKKKTKKIKKNETAGKLLGIFGSFAKAAAAGTKSKKGSSSESSSLAGIAPKKDCATPCGRKSK